jgi:ATP-dependent helicase/nuclease subunit B
MEKKVYMGRLFSRRREKLIDMCMKLQEQGKRFLYIMPSSAAIFQVRDKFVRERRGFLGSRVIVFDDLELDIVKSHLNMGNVIFEPMDRVIVASVCKSLRDSFKYYKNIYNKKGFHQELTSLIRNLKRSCVDEEGFLEVKEKVTDEILRDKLHDLENIYRGYNSALRENGIYDRNDVSLRAIELLEKYKNLEGIDTIVIDGFTDIEAVSMGLVREISALEKNNIFVNVPYGSSFNDDFLKNEIEKPLKGMGFEIALDEDEFYEINPEVKELCEKFYSGEKVVEGARSLDIIKYPCIEAEVRETARSIKERIMKGEIPEEIGIYLKNRDAYSDSMISIFKEFGLPLSMTQEINLGSSGLVRKIIKGFKEREEESLALSEWIKLLEEEIEAKHEYIGELVARAINEELSFVDKLELKAFDALRKLAEDTERSFEKSGMIGDALSREGFVDYMVDGITATNITIEQGNDRGVRVMDTALAKGVYFNHVYILGLNEGEIPSAVKTTGLFDSFELKSLKELGISYKNFLWELTREKIRFNLALSSARNTLTLSYRSADEDGKFAIASSFIDEVKFLTGAEEKKSLTMRDRFEGDLENVMSSQELELGFVKSYFEGMYKGEKPSNTGLDFVASSTQNTTKVLKTGLIQYHREKERDFNQFEGVIGQDFEKIAEVLGKFSPSALNSYLDCPFKYMVTNLYKPGEEEEDETELSSLEIGDLYHKVLYSYYNNVRQFESLDGALFERVFSEVFEALREINADPEELQRRRSEFYKRLKEFITLDVERLKNFENQTGGRLLRPYLLEGFMSSKNMFDAPINCKIDRIDLEYENRDERLVPTGRYVIYDYKKNSTPGLNDILQNSDYQLPIYYYLADDYIKSALGLKNTECMSLLYMSIEGTEKANKKRKKQQLEVDGIYKTEHKKALTIDKKADIKGENFPILMEYIRGLISKTIGMIKAGKFNYKPMCEQYEGFTQFECEYKRICRYSKSKMRALGEETL